MQLAGPGKLKGPADRRRQSRHDTREDNDRYTVANTSLAHLLSEPHEEDCTGDQGGDRGNSETPTRVDDYRQGAGLLGFKGNRYPEGLKQCERLPCRIAYIA